GGVAQLVRALACHARGRGFEPRRSRHKIEHVACSCDSTPSSGSLEPSRVRAPSLPPVILGVILKIETEILHPARSLSTCVAKRCLLPDDFSRENCEKTH